MTNIQKESGQKILKRELRTCIKANISGFGVESLETIGVFSHDINYSMTNVIIGMYLICTIGTIIDTSISVSSAMNEIYENNKIIY